MTVKDLRASLRDIPDYFHVLVDKDGRGIITTSTEAALVDKDEWKELIGCSKHFHPSFIIDSNACSPSGL